MINIDSINVSELEIKDITETVSSASYLHLHLDIDGEGRIKTQLYDKRDEFNFPIVNYLFICSIIPAAPADIVISLAVDLIFQSLWLAIMISLKGVAANKEATEPGVPSEYIEVITSQVSRLPSCYM